MHRKEMRLTVLILRLFFSLFIVAINTLRPKRNLFSRAALHCCALVCF